MRTNRLKCLLSIVCLVWSPVFTGQALGQIAEDETTVTYPRSYFDQYGPVTAKDMLDRIPGLGSTTGGGPPGSGGGFRGGGGGGGGRGFGSGSGSSEILINGKRTAGKNNQTSGVLTRISSDQVDYIQLIRGTSGELDVRGSGQVINIVTFEELSTSSTQYQVNADPVPGQCRSSSGRQLSTGGQRVLYQPGWRIEHGNKRGRRATLRPSGEQRERGTQ
jgi:hypothetical protein